MARGDRWWSEPPWWAWVVLVAGAVFIAVGVPFAASRGQLSASELERMQADAAASTTAETGADGTQPQVAFLGDSYTAGSGSTSGDGYVRATADGMGWAATAFGQGGTGYTNDGDDPGEHVYLDRVSEVIAAAPDVVVVQGSTNDYAASSDEIHDAAVAVYKALQAGLPDAQIIAVGPLAPPDSDPRLTPNIVAGLQQAATESGVPFIDPVGEGWLQPTAALFADGFHPNDEGYRQMAALLVADLRPLVDVA